MTTQSEVYSRIRAFQQRYRDLGYGDGQYGLLCLAAFPLAVSPDLLYRLWNNFRGVFSDKLPIDRVAVADVLLWPNWRETAPDVFELDEEVRNELLTELKQLDQERQHREPSSNLLQELAQFLYQYTTQTTTRIDQTLLRQAQLLGVQAMLAPEQAARRVEAELTEYIRAGNESEILRMRNLVGALASLHADFDPLLSVTKGLKAYLLGMPQAVWQRQFVRPNETVAGQVLGMSLDTNVADDEPYLMIPLPKEMEGQITLPEWEVPAQSKRLFLLTIGINASRKGCVNDAQLLSDILPTYFKAYNQEVLKRELHDEDATKKSILDALSSYLSQADSNDIVVFTFSGHGQNSRQGATKNAIAAHKMSGSGPQWGFLVGKELTGDHVITEMEFSELVSSAAKNDPHILLILDTPSGNSNWLNPNNPKHIILTAGSDWDAVEERKYENKPHGVLTAALVRALRSSHSLQTYRSLIRNIYQIVQEDRCEQTPQLFGKYEALNNQFLSTNDSNILYLQELGRECNYYKGPFDGQHSKRMLSLNAIKDDYDVANLIRINGQITFPLETSPSVLKEYINAYELLATVRSANTNQFSVIFFGDRIDTETIKRFDRELTGLPYNVTSRYVDFSNIQEELSGSQRSSAPKFSSLQESSHLEESPILNAPLDLLESDPSSWRTYLKKICNDNQAIFLLLTNSLTQDINSQKWADHLAYYTRFEYKLLFPILLEEFTWEDSPLKHVLVYPINGRAFNVWASPDEAWNQVAREVWAVLKLYSSFYSESAHATALRSIGKAAVGTNQSFVSGFLIAPDVLLTSNLQIDSKDRASQATVSFTDVGGLTALFNLLPERFFLTDAETGVSLIGVSQSPIRSDYRTSRTLNDYFTLKLASEPVKPGDQLYAANFDQSQQFRPNTLTVDFYDEGRIQYHGPTRLDTAGGPLLNENLEIVAMNLTKYERWSDFEVVDVQKQTLPDLSATVPTLTSLLQRISDRFSNGEWIDDDGILVQDIVDQAGNSLKFNHLYSQPVRVYIDMINADAKTELSRLLNNDQDIIQLQIDEKKSDYVIRERSGQFYITYPAATDEKNIFRPLAAPVKSDKLDALSVLESDLKHIARWDYLQKFTNPSKINDLPKEPLDIRIWEVRSDGSESVINLDGINANLRYWKRQVKWVCQLRVELTNKTNYTLYVGALYLSINFESNPDLLLDDVYTLEPGKSIQLMKENNPILHFKMDEIIPLYNWPTQTEYFKFMSSTKSFDIHIMETKALSEPVSLSDRGGSREAKYNRGIGRVSWEKISITNWATQSIALNWQNPLYGKTSAETVEAMYADLELNPFAIGLYPSMVKPDWQFNGNTLLVTGTGKYKLTDIEINVSEAIGLMLATEQYGLIGGGWPGVDHLVGKTYTEKLTELAVSGKDYFTQLVVANQQPDYKGGSVVRVENDSEWYREAISRASAVIMIGGLGGTYTTFEKARNRHIPIIPLVTTRGDARSAYFNQKDAFLEIHSKNQELCTFYKKLDDDNLTEIQLAEIARSMLALLLLPLKESS